jgi:hypothetical protein
MATHADFTRLMKALRVRVPGALDDAIRLELFSTTDEFLRVSQLWTEEIPFSTILDETFYEIESEETTAKINRLLFVKNEDDRLISATMAVVGELTLTNPPPAGDTYTATVALTISDPTDSDNNPRIPVWILEKYRETFMDGTVGRLMSQLAKPYANERMAVYHLRRWRDGLAQARVDARHKNVDSANSWVFPRGWA